jgi:hypothetical protein
MVATCSVQLLLGADLLCYCLVLLCYCLVLLCCYCLAGFELSSMAQQVCSLGALLELEQDPALVELVED